MLNPIAFSHPPPLRGRTTRLDFRISRKSICRVRWGNFEAARPLPDTPPTPAHPLKGEGGRITRELGKFNHAVARVERAFDLDGQNLKVAPIGRGGRWAYSD